MAAFCIRLVVSVGAAGLGYLMLSTIEQDLTSQAAGVLIILLAAVNLLPLTTRSE
jgi:hypothetical protein